jgi:uncharacterized membrane protein
MEPKRSKYDTNPLDEDFAHRATDSFSANEPATTAGVQGGPTRPMNSAESDAVQAYSESEAPTRHINDRFTSYPSVFVPPPPKPATTYQPPRPAAAGIYRPPPTPPPNIYQPPMLPLQKPGSNTVAGIGIPERWAVLLPYLPFWLAIVASVIELVLVPRSESRVRFHASQGLVLQLAVTAISMLLTFAGFLSGGRFTGAGVFNFATFVFFVIAMIRVWKGKPFVIPPLDEPRKWLDEKIRPRK